ncbi:MAG: hypothetical protein FJ265_13300 [Planctomycetes bacterium]|nr:hypothetical protein [Planctomycetota bacterium]
MSAPRSSVLVVLLAGAASAVAQPELQAEADWIWVEGEAASRSTMVRHPWYTDLLRQHLSGGDCLCHFADDRPGEATCEFTARAAGRYRFWLRANPVQSVLQWSLDDGPFAPVRWQGGLADQVNVAADGKVDLRFLAWVEVGEVELTAGRHRLEFRADSEKHHHGMVDCFCLVRGPFVPAGTRKPGEKTAAEPGWVAWEPVDEPGAEDPLDLRRLNEPFAGAHGRIVAARGRFVREGDGEAVRFWGVNGPPRGLDGAELSRCLRQLARYGVNLVRVHHAVFDVETGAIDGAAIDHHRAVVAAAREHGIYSLLSIYFPLWMKPRGGDGWRRGYDGRRHPFALLFFDHDFQALYRSWWRELLTKKDAAGRCLLDEPSLFAIELVNEDSFFFWTFAYENVPEPHVASLEARFATWVEQRHGSLAAALASWGGTRHPRDDAAQRRLGLRSLWEIARQRTRRDQDTVAFLLELQRGFYTEQILWLRELGFRGLITASNWTTADQRVLGPLEKYSYAVGDFVDRHGYFGGHHEGPESNWSIREGHVYADRSALRFDAERPGKAPLVQHPAMDPAWNGLPSTISETTWNRPNRYRTEAPLFCAAYGALQGSDGVVHFALDGARWTVRPQFFAQPWTLMAPTQMGQFPAAALVFRQGLVAEGEVMAQLDLPLADALALRGTRLVQQANLDALRQADARGEGGGGDVDPRVHFVGRSEVRVGDVASRVRVRDLVPFVDHAARTVTSVTRELRLDHGRGVLTIDAVRAQGALGDLAAAGNLRLRDVEIRCGMDLAAVVLVPLDGEPLATSRRMLLQCMSEERPTGFRTEPAGEGLHRIVALGGDPWQVREMAGAVRFRAAVRCTPLRGGGGVAGPAERGPEVRLRPDTFYYLIER